jgi:hypothetical protein
MDGQPSLAAGWEISETDPRVLSRKTIGYIPREGCWHLSPLTLVDILDESGRKAPSNSLNEAVVVGIVDRIWNLVPFWRELYRVCKAGAQATIVGPYWTSTEAQADPTRIRGLSEQMFYYLSPHFRAGMRTELFEDGYGLDLLADVDFDPIRFVRTTGPEWEARSEDAKAWALLHNVNICKRLEVTLTVYKPVRSVP